MFFWPSCKVILQIRFQAFKPAGRQWLLYHYAEFILNCQSIIIINMQFFGLKQNASLKSLILARFVQHYCYK